MTEPTISGITIAAGAVTLTGSIFGMQWDALLIGLFGGLIALQHLGPMASKWQLASSLAGAAVLAALLSPVAHAAVPAYVSWAAKLDADILRRACALLIGIGGQVAVPLLLSWIGAIKRPEAPK